jgi:hypothetical protein
VWSSDGESRSHLRTAALLDSCDFRRHWRLDSPRSGILRVPAAQSITKVALLAGSIAFWWYANIPIQNVIIGVALFELLHDIHYLAFVWTFKHSEQEGVKGDTSPLGGIFRKTFGSVVFYIGLTVAYGVFFRGNEAILNGPALQLLAVAVLVSTLMHFYTDSFIWNLREKSTRQTLGVDDYVVATSPSRGLG